MAVGGFNIPLWWINKSSSQQKERNMKIKWHHRSDLIEICRALSIQIHVLLSNPWDFLQNVWQQALSFCYGLILIASKVEHMWGAYFPLIFPNKLKVLGGSVWSFTTGFTTLEFSSFRILIHISQSFSSQTHFNFSTVFSYFCFSEIKNN